MTSVISEKPILVTGATGFIAGHTIKLLLEQGNRVRGTVRDLNKTSGYEFLKKLPNAETHLEFVEADLSNKNAFDEAVHGCEYVLHLASPFVLEVKDPQNDLVTPAIQGTLSALQASVKDGHVKRVVVTSSVASVAEHGEDGRTYNENDWNTDSTLHVNSYYFSKVEAEKAALEYMKTEEAKQSGLELAVICPSYVIGPSLSNIVNTSNQIFQKIMTKGELPGVVSLSFPQVDVRDVARAHILALTADLSKVEEARFICHNKTSTMKEVIEVLKQEFPEYPYPTFNLSCGVGDSVVKLASWFQPRGMRQYMQANIGKPLYFDNSKIKNTLGLEFGDINQTILDTARDMIEKKQIPDPK